MSEDTDVYKRLWTEGGNGDRLTNEFIGRTVCAKWAQQLRSGDADTIGRVADTLEQIADGANPREVLFSKTPHKKIARDMLVATFVNAHLRNTDCSQNEACKHVAYPFGLNWENVERIWERTSHLVIPNETMRGGRETSHWYGSTCLAKHPLLGGRCTASHPQRRGFASCSTTGTP